MAVHPLISQVETYFEQRERCFGNCWSTHLQLKQLDQQAAGWFYLLSIQREQIIEQDADIPDWLSLIFAQTVAEMVLLLQERTSVNNVDTVCLQWWAQRHNGAALLAALIAVEKTGSVLTKQLLCVIGSATSTVNDQFDFRQVSNIQPHINFINQHLGKASQAWFSHFHQNLNAENSKEIKLKKVLEFVLCRGLSKGQLVMPLPKLSSPLLADKQLIKQYIVQANSRQAGLLINELSAHNDNATFVLSLMALSGYKQFVPWLIQMLTAGFLSHAAFTALHSLLGDAFEAQLPADLYGEFEPETQTELLDDLKQSLTEWWQEHRADYPERILAGKGINADNLALVWQQGNILHCEIAAYHHWCADPQHRLTDATGFNVGAML